jgi:hypothetical protein
VTNRSGIVVTMLGDLHNGRRFISPSAFVLPPPSLSPDKLTRGRTGSRRLLLYRFVADAGGDR